MDFGHGVFERRPAGPSVCSEGYQGHAVVVLLTLVSPMCRSQVAASLVECFLVFGRCLVSPVGKPPPQLL
ncbi:hypothetical protein FOVG_05288 [Fusarium oxysporum f. sp. pisi HDV247]|uniref:Uncharacterized protein n=1 Tax=Fusarium oxysporum f. sp. pisi HDV247 TaxID=1080344 RepID=W9PTZ2_FUSOX|nr:hypothetical protein FOVG_05288 [Fusarium oxysporum f. sp. pisi HDV247]